MALSKSAVSARGLLGRDGECSETFWKNLFIGRVIKANGVTFTEATAEQSAEMSSIVKPVVEDYLINNCQFTADEMDAFFAELAK